MTLRRLWGLEAEEVYPERLECLEWRQLRTRAAVNRDEVLSSVGEVAGVALSGGGIRSATLSLGVFQWLATKGLLKHVAFLSTVSGGGYFGSFFGRWLGRPGPSAGARPLTLRDVEAELAKPIGAAAKPVENLRENGRYLAPNGSGDLLLALAIALRNWLSTLAVASVFLLTCFLALQWLATAIPYLSRPHLPDVLHWYWSSPWYGVGLWALVFLALPLGWAYWLTPSELPRRKVQEWLFRWAGPVGVIILTVWQGSARAPGETPLLITIRDVALASVTFYGAAWLTSLTLRLKRKAATPMMRHHLSRWLVYALAVVAGFLALGVIDASGRSLYLASARGQISAAALFGTLSTAVAGIGALGRTLGPLLQGIGGRRRQPIPTGILLDAGAIILATSWLAGLSYVAVGFAWRWKLPDPLTAELPTSVGLAVQIPLAAAVAATVLTGWVWSFVNRSSMHAFYEARLSRAYLGASNPGREKERRPVVMTHPDDGIPMSQYHPERYGGPIHLINVTVNETVRGESRIEQQDRKGLGMAVGPCGLSVGRRYHALWHDQWEPPSLIARVGRGAQRWVKKWFHEAAADETPPTYRVFPDDGDIFPEELDLGDWVAISGAAFSTGLGYRTSLGLSFLAGFFNIRLGYWWDSGICDLRREGQMRITVPQWFWRALAGLLPVHAALLDEWLARFPGVARRRWYLTDGGHFENLGGYELIRRRLPFIVVCDNEEDVDYEFAGLGNLVRKARLDFGVEITFLDSKQLKQVLGDPARYGIGTLDDLRRGLRRTDAAEDPCTGDTRVSLQKPSKNGLSLAHAALALVKYSDDRSGALLYLKPTLTGCEPADILEYHRHHAAFPHESTVDQFFDEAQWESYRRLGACMARRLWSAGGEPGKWSPLDALTKPAEARDTLVKCLEWNGT
jgi:hypothetical protein